MARTQTPSNGYPAIGGRRSGSGSGSGTAMDLAKVGFASPESVPEVPTVVRANQDRSKLRLDRDRAMGMVADVVADPIALSPDERYFCGHYLAYLLGGSRRQGFLRRRPLDPLNADRARLMLAMTWLMIEGPGEGVLERAAALLESRYDVRPLLSPIVVTKYLLGSRHPGQAEDVPRGPQAAPGGQPLRRRAP